jgi:hypothetical protein
MPAIAAPPATNNQRRDTRFANATKPSTPPMEHGGFAVTECSGQLGRS